MARILLCLILAAVIGSCGKPRASDSKFENVFGNDDREELVSSQYPWSTIGRLLSPNGGACTGTLVAKNLVLTAAHCIVDPKTKRLLVGAFSFQPNFKNGAAVVSYKTDWFWWGTSEPDSNRSQDWAIIQLFENAGERFGWLNVLPTFISSIPTQISMAGYSGNFRNGHTAGLHKNCSIRKRDAENGYVLHDCDSSTGASGGPMLHGSGINFNVVGINVAEYRGIGTSSLFNAAYDDSYANVAIPTADVVEKIKQILTQQN